MLIYFLIAFLHRVRIYLAKNGDGPRCLARGPIHVVRSLMHPIHRVFIILLSHVLRLLLDRFYALKLREYLLLIIDKNLDFGWN